jgi:ABC-type polysaccharide/polyol phosphate export permease
MLTRMFQEVYAFRDLLFALAYRDIRVKYKQAVMGILWVFFMPLLAISSGIVFRIAMSVFSGQELQLASVVGVMVKSVPWLLFAGIIGSASNSLVGNMGLITKIYFPREIVPISGMISCLFDFAISVTGLAAILVGVAVFAPGQAPAVVASWNLLLLPVLVALLVLMGAGLGLFLAAANLFYRDVKYIVQVLLQFGIFFSLVYFTHHELGQYGWLFLLNPVAPILEAIRNIVVDGAIEPALHPWLGYSVICSLVWAMFGAWVFDKAEYLFAEYA